MVDDTYRLKMDIQNCIANHIIYFKAKYSHLFFEGDYFENIRSLNFLDKLNVTVENEELIFDMKLNEEIFNCIDAETLLQIKKINWKNQMIDIWEQELIDNEVILSREETMEIVENLRKEIEKRNKIYRKLKVGESDYFLEIKNNLKENFNLDFNLKITSDFIALEYFADKIEMNQQLLEFLLKEGLKMDMLLIAPQIDESTDKIIGVRIFMANKLLEVVK